MFIGTPKEIKTDEFRVGLVPATVADLVARGHAVAIETRAGEEFSAVRYTYVDPSAPGGWSTFANLLETSPG